LITDSQSKKIQQFCEIETSAGRFSYFLRRSRRRRTLEISIRDNADIVVSAPSAMAERRIRDFIRQRDGWIARHLKRAREERRRVPPKHYVSGETFYFLGKKYPLIVVMADRSLSRIAFNGAGWTIRIPRLHGETERRRAVRKKLISWYQKEAKEILGGRVFHYARMMHLDPLTIGIRGQKRIWGSCHVRRRSIQLNWQLIQAPMDAIDYVVVHELSHLMAPDHSKHFWRQVARILPDYKKRQQWIKDNRRALRLPP